MGYSRPRPKRLAKKLLQIRLSLAMSQGEMVKRLGVQDLIHYTTISKYELDKNEPPLAILLAYARLAGIPVEQIIDDEVELTIWFPQKYRDRFLAINFPTTSRRGPHRVDIQFPNESLPSANSVTSAPRPCTDPSKERYRSLRCVGRSRVYAAFLIIIINLKELVSELRSVQQDLWWWIRMGLVGPGSVDGTVYVYPSQPSFQFSAPKFAWSTPRPDGLRELKTVRSALDCLPRYGLRIDKSC